MIFLHVGVMKTGTTYLQRLMWKNRAALADAGILVPGEGPADQAKAVRDKLRINGADPKVIRRTAGYWERLTAQMLVWDGTASVFSMEFLSFANKRRAAEVVRSLSPAEVHVILTIRDTAEVLPAQWQTHARNRGTASWPEFARAAATSLEKHDDQAAKTFLRAQNVPRMLKVWGSAVPAKQLQVVTVPPRGSSQSLLWDRFAGVIGVDAEVCSRRNIRSNASLGQPSADFMRRLNRYLVDVPVSDYDRVMRRLARDVLSPRSEVEPRASIDPATRTFAREWNERVRTAVVDSGAQVVGDLGELPTTASQETALAAGVDSRLEPEPAEVLAAAAVARDGVIAVLRKRGAKVPDEATTPERWRGDTDPVEAATAEVARLLRKAMRVA